MRASTRILAWTAVTILSGVATSAAEEDPLRVGARLRVGLSDPDRRSILGTLRRIDARELEIEEPGLTGTTRVRRDSVERLDISVGVQRQGRKGALIGAGVGWLVFLLASEIGQYPCEGCSQGQYFEISVIGATLLGAPAGALVGGLVGHQVRSEQWRELAIPRERPSVAMRFDGRRAVSLSLRF